MPIPVETLITSDAKLNESCLRSIPKAEHDECVSIVTAFGAKGVDQSQLLDDIFDTSFSSSSSSSPSSSPSPSAPSSSSSSFVKSAIIRGHDSAVVTEPPRHLAVLDVEPYDSPMSERDDIRDMAWSLTLSLSNAVLLLLRMRDIVRPQCNGLDGLRGALTQWLLLQADQLVPIVPGGKRVLIIVVRDYETDVASRDEVVSGILLEIQNIYKAEAKPPRAPSRLSDIFEFEFALLPSHLLSPQPYAQALQQLRQRLLDPTTNDYIFEGGAYAMLSSSSRTQDSSTSSSNDTDIVDIAQAAWKRMEKDRTQDVPPKKDLISAFDCDNAMRNVFEKYQRDVRVWKRETDGGIIIDQFGMHAAKTMKDMLSMYERNANQHKGSKAFRRKREELKDLLDADLYNLFVVQIAKLRESTYRNFKERLNSIAEAEPKLDRMVKTLLKDVQKEFRISAQALKPNPTSWRYDNDAQELASKMREDATDKLQRARIADYQEGGGRRNRRRAAAIASATPRRRQPISLGIHYLDPAPFGFKDSRFEKLNNEDHCQYQPDASVFSGGSRTGGMAVPISPGRDSGWNRNGEFVYNEREQK